MNVVYLSLGSNLGDKQAHLNQVIELLEKSQIKITERSAVYETAPWGVKDQQPTYLNQVLKISTDLYPFGLLKVLQKIENTLGRTQKGDFQPRTADIDIILFNDWVLHHEKLTIPHERFRERVFVLEPLGEIAPGIIDPVTGKSITELLLQCQNTGK